MRTRLVYCTSMTLCIELCYFDFAIYMIRYDLAFPGIRLLTRRYQNLPDLSQIQLLHLVSLFRQNKNGSCPPLLGYPFTKFGAQTKLLSNEPAYYSGHSIRQPPPHLHVVQDFIH